MAELLISHGSIMAVWVFAIVFGGAIVGLGAHRVLPETLTSGGARDMTGAVVGLLTLLLALVLGLLIWTAFGVYTNQKISVQSLSASMLRIDSDLHQYGESANEGRKLLRDLAQRAIRHVWHPDEGVSQAYVHGLSGGQTIQRYLDSLTPQTDEQKAAKADASATTAGLIQLRLQMALSLGDPISYPLMWLVVGWAAILFFGYGFMTKATPFAFVMAAVGALAVASAIYAIVDLSTPYSGLFEVSSKPITDVLTVVDTLAARTKPKP